MLVLRHLPTLRRVILCDPGNSLSPLALCPIYGAQYSNHLTALPPEIAQLSQLTTLDVSHNQLTALPPEIAQLSQLTTLEVPLHKTGTDF